MELQCKHKVSVEQLAVRYTSHNLVELMTEMYHKHVHLLSLCGGRCGMNSNPSTFIHDGCHERSDTVDIEA